MNDAHPATSTPAEQSVLEHGGSVSEHRAWLLRWLGIASAVLLLAMVFLAYLRPEFALDLANRFILCL